MKVTKQITAKETLNILNRQWLGTKDLAKVAGVGINHARILRREIAKSITDDTGKYLPNNLLPTERVITYLGINIAYLNKIAKINE